MSLKLKARLIALTSRELHGLRLADGLAVAHDFGADFIVVVRASLQAAAKRLTIGAGAGRGQTVDEHLGIGRTATLSMPWVPRVRYVVLPPASGSAGAEGEGGVPPAGGATSPGTESIITPPCEPPLEPPLLP